MVINEIQYNPLLPEASYVELLNASANTCYDLSHWRLKGLDYTFPAGATLAGGEYLLLVKDRSQFTAAYGLTLAPFDEFGGNLQMDGETLTLTMPAPQTNQPDMIVDRVKYSAAAPWPSTAPGVSLQLKDPAQDHFRVGNWATAPAGPPAGQQWVHYSAAGTASSSVLYIYLQAAGEVYLDDLKLVAGSVPDAGVNVLADGDFESGFPGSWNVSPNLAASSLSTQMKHSGAASLHVVASSGGTSQSTSIHQTISPALAPGMPYALSFWCLQSTNPSVPMLTVRLSGSGIVANVNPGFSSGSTAVPATPGSSNSVRTILSPFPPLWINELQADNLTGITNSGGQRTAWLELYNPSTNTVSLTNLYLTGAYTNLTAWSFPTGAVINPGQFKVIFADGQTNLSTINEPHTSFALPSGAGSVALSWIANAQTQVLDYVDYTNLTPNRSYGSFPDGQSFDRQEFAYATPGRTNNNTSAPLSVVINEWMAANTHTLPNPLSGKFSDWFELYNYGTNVANLAGYYLTDNLTNRFQFQIPAGYTIPPHGFLLVWADGRNTNGTADLHATFKLDKAGEGLGLFGGDGNPVDYLSYGPQTDDVSQGRFPDGANAFYFMPPATPRTNNVIPNTAPGLAAISNWIVQVGQTVCFTATATDAESPPQTLTFSLDPAAPAGASIHPTTGAFAWDTTGLPVPTTETITIRVTDNGTPPLSATATFSVNVVPVPPTIIAQPGSQTNFLGGSATFIVTADGTAPLYYQWQCNNEDIVGQTNSSLSLNCLSTTNQGNYRARVFNAAGSTNSQDAGLTVVVPTASWLSYADPGQVYTQAFDSLPNPGANSVNADNPVGISGVTYALANPLEFAFPASSCASIPGGLGLGGTLAGWYGWASGAGQLGASPGDQGNGGVISFGLTNSPDASMNRALGLLATGLSGPTAFGVKFINQTTNTLTQITLHFTGELWRQSAVAKTLAVAYWIDPTATNLLSTNLTAALPGLNVSFPPDPAAIAPIAMDGTMSSNQVCVGVIDQTITDWPPGAALWLRWDMNDAAGEGQGLAIDNLSFSASMAPPNIAPVLAPLQGQVVYRGQMVHFTASATDTDQPPQVLTFTLDPGAPAGASIHPTTGAFTWVTTSAPVPGTNTITIRVTDNGTPPLSATGTVSVTILPLPQLSTTRPAGTILPLSFSTLKGQMYQVLYKDSLTDPVWTPLNVPVLGTGEVLEVDDDVTCHPQRFYRLLSLGTAGPNTAPVLAPLQGQFLYSGQTVHFIASATDTDQPPQVLTFTLDAGAPAGASIHPTTGAFTWVTTNAPVPSTNSITIRVTDNGTPPLSATGTFSVAILPLPELSTGRPAGTILPLSFNTLRGQTYQVLYKNSLSDPCWTPLNVPVPGTGGVLEVSDDMTGHPQRFYRLLSVWTPSPNTAPVLAPIQSQFLYGGQTVHFTASATDTDQPPQILTFTLDPGAPAGASIHPTTGAFTWATTNAAVPNTNTITIRVTDNGAPALSATGTFSVTILPLPQLSTGRPTGTILPLSFSTLRGQTYQVLYKNNVTDPVWVPLNAPVAGTGGVLVVDDDMTGHPQRFYRLLSVWTPGPNTAPVLAPMQSQLLYGGQTLHFTASATDTDQPPQVLTFTLDAGAPAGASIHPTTGAFAWATTNAPVPSTNNITIRVTDNGTPALSATGTFSVTVLPLPQLSTIKPAGAILSLSFGTLRGQTYQVLYKNNLADPSWIPLDVPLSGTGGVLEVNDDITTHEQRFYRLAVVP